MSLPTQSVFTCMVYAVQVSGDRKKHVLVIIKRNRETEEWILSVEFVLHALKLF